MEEDDEGDEGEDEVNVDTEGDEATTEVVVITVDAEDVIDEGLLIIIDRQLINLLITITLIWLPFKMIKQSSD